MVDLTIITRAELPPASITLQTCAHAIPLPTAPNLYRIHLYLLADTTYTIDCDNQAVTSAYLQNFCFAFVDARSTPLPYSRAYDAFGYILPILAWMAFVVVALHASRASSTLAWVLVSVAGAIALMLLEKYDLQIVSWRFGIVNLFGGASIVIWGSERLRFPVRQLLILVVLAMVLNYSGALAPGAPGIDLPVHAQQLENVMSGNLYLQNSGTLYPVAGDKAVTPTYPYPPSIYLLPARFALLLQPPFSLMSIMGTLSILLEALFVIGLVWLVDKNRLPRRVAILACLMYLFFPQSSVLQNYPTPPSHSPKQRGGYLYRLRMANQIQRIFSNAFVWCCWLH